MYNSCTVHIQGWRGQTFGFIYVEFTFTKGAEVREGTTPISLKSKTESLYLTSLIFTNLVAFFTIETVVNLIFNRTNWEFLEVTHRVLEVTHHVLTEFRKFPALRTMYSKDCSFWLVSNSRNKNEC